MPVLHAAVELTVVSPDTTRARRSLTIGGRLPKYRIQQKSAVDLQKVLDGPVQQVGPYERAIQEPWYVDQKDI